MKKKLNQILNIIMALLLVCSLVQDYINIGILVNGLLVLVLLAVCMTVKVIFIEKIGRIQKIALILGIVFLTLTFIGGCYVLANHGQANAGYAVVPGIWTMICFGYYRSKNRANSN